ncbi:DUF2127 domain-containing protein [Bdellovibrio sp. HCB274]|uniref:DUF2127 domain-containing protein n=1 Tax=Bdellovibrio sp. HCB274 TaxID=3394361 RepID=UPI0039B6C0FF
MLCGKIALSFLLVKVDAYGQRDYMGGIRFIATLEATKGFVVLLLSIGLLSLMGQDIQSLGVQVSHYLGVEHNHLYKSIFSALKQHSHEIRQVAFLAIFYSALRFIEAYGLWNERTWAEWFAIISGGVYLPFEIDKLIEKFEWWKVLITAVNILIVAYLVFYKIRRDRRLK